MKIGFSSFSFFDRLHDGSMTIGDVVRWIVANDGQHLEIATVTFGPRGEDETWNLDDDPDLLDSIRSESRASGLELSGLCVPADFLVSSTDDLRRQIDRVKHHVQLSDSMGIRYLRHDVVQWKYAGSDILEFEHSLPVLVDACKEIATFAARYGITTSVENHGFYMNASERVRRLIYEVDEPNFRTTLDIGNFLCVDEDPLIGTINNLPYAAFVHLKDFYMRTGDRFSGGGWISTTGGRHLLGSIIGFGDMEVEAILGRLLDSAYDGFVSIEFEGLEDCLLGCSAGMTNVRKILGQAAALQGDRHAVTREP